MRLPSSLREARSSRPALEAVGLALVDPPMSGSCKKDADAGCRHSGSPGVRQDHVTGLLADHVDGQRDEEAGYPREYGSIHHPQVSCPIDAESRIQDRHGVVLSTDLVAARRVMTPRLVLDKLADLFVCI